MHLTIEIIGWVGMIVLLTAYFRRHSFSHVKHALFNLAAGSLIAPICYVIHAWPLFALQLIWGSIAIRDLFRAIKETKHTAVEAS